MQKQTNKTSLKALLTRRGNIENRKINLKKEKNKLMRTQCPVCVSSSMEGILRSFNYHLPACCVPQQHTFIFPVFCDVPSDQRSLHFSVIHEVFLFQFLICFVSFCFAEVIH